MDTLNKIKLAAAKSSDEEKANLMKKAKTELDRTDKLFSNSETKNRMDTLKDMYTQCEIIYKSILRAYKNNTGKEISSKEEVSMKEVPYALAYAGYVFDLGFLKKLFGSETTQGKMSVKKVRDDLTHKIRKSALKELSDRYEELIGYMETFLNTIRNSA